MRMRGYRFYSVVDRAVVGLSWLCFIVMSRKKLKCRVQVGVELSTSKSIIDVWLSLKMKSCGTDKMSLKVHSAHAL